MKLSKHSLIPLGIFVLTFLLYSHTLQYEFVRWDDDLLVTDNPIIRGLTPWTIWKAFTSYDPELYIPLTFLSYQINYALGGTGVLWYHLTNVLLHAGNAVIVYFLTLRFVGVRLVAEEGPGLGPGPGQGNNRENPMVFLIPFLCALLFAFHPINTEAAVWISARKDVLSTFFFLLSLLAYSKTQTRTQTRTRKWYVFSFLAFLLALLSKVTVTVLPVILLLVIWRDEGRLSIQRIKEVIPFFVLSILFGLIAIFGKAGLGGVLRPWEVFVMASRSTVFYLQKFLWPVDLSVLYPYYGEIQFFTVDFFVPFLILLLIFSFFTLHYLVSRMRFAGVTVLRRCSGWPRLHTSMVESRSYLFCFLCFLIVLAPSFLHYRKGLDGLDVYVAVDRYAYLASVFVVLLVGLLVSRIYARRKTCALCVFLICVIAVIFAKLSYRQAQVWSSSFTLFSHVLSLTPNSHAAHDNLGTEYYLLGDLRKAEEHYVSALSTRRLPSTLSNLASVYRRQGKLEESLALYEEAITLRRNEKQAWFGLGLLFAQAGDPQKAQIAYEEAIAIDPNFAKAYLNLGALALQSGDDTEAIEWYEKAITINPFYASARYNLSAIYVRQGRVAEAIDQLERVVEIEPEFSEAREALNMLRNSKSQPSTGLMSRNAKSK